MNLPLSSSIMTSLALFFHLLAPSNALAAANTLKYTYDALGRLTFVEDPVNGNRDYDYDAAGNRTQVGVGQQLDDAPVVKLDAPTGLTCTGPISSSGGYKASWNAVSGAAYYLYQDGNGTEKKVTTTTATLTAACLYVKACDSNNSCGEKSTF